jgi:hypothetical protein
MTAPGTPAPVDEQVDALADQQLGALLVALLVLRAASDACHAELLVEQLEQAFVVRSVGEELVPGDVQVALEGGHA